MQSTQELEQSHREALDAQALVHAGKVKELEAEWDELKEQTLKLSKEKDRLNSALAEAPVGVESSEGRRRAAWGGVRGANLNDHMEGEKRWLERLVVIANSVTT